MGADTADYNVRRGVLKYHINDKLEEIPKELKTMVSSCLKTYFKALKTFGINSEITKNSLLVLKDMVKIYNYEEKLLNYLSKNIKKFDDIAACNVFDTLNKLSDKTFKNYGEIILNIDDACNIQDKKMFTKPEKINSVINNKLYTNYVYALNCNNEDIKKFLGFSDDFWKCVEKNLREVDDYYELDLNIYGVKPILNRSGKIVNIYSLVPKVVDYQSAMIAIDVYTKAYNYYLNIGKSLDEINIETDNNKEKELYIKKLKK